MPFAYYCTRPHHADDRERGSRCCPRPRPHETEFIYYSG
ncbi:hypothetical protein RSAG8_11807, partial [Rhizoctonia solani AG-8 WAC10335]